MAIKVTLPTSSLYDSRPEKVECIEIRMESGLPATLLFQLSDNLGRKIGLISVDVVGDMHRSVEQITADSAKEVHGVLIRLASSAEQLALKRG